jgi:hypothetical protein
MAAPTRGGRARGRWRQLRPGKHVRKKVVGWVGKKVRIL